MTTKNECISTVCIIGLMVVCVVCAMIGYSGGRQDTINKIARGEITIVTNALITTTYEAKSK